MPLAHPTHASRPPAHADPVRRAALVAAVHGVAICVLGVLSDPHVLGSESLWLPWSLLGRAWPAWQLGAVAGTTELLAAAAMLYGSSLARIYLYGLAILGVLANALFPAMGVFFGAAAPVPLPSGTGRWLLGFCGLSLSFGVVWRLVRRRATADGVEARAQWRAQRRAQRRYGQPGNELWTTAPAAPMLPEETPQKQRSLRFWVLWYAGFSVAVAATLAVLVGRDAVVCRNDLATVAEPAGWRAWPVLPKLGGFHVKADAGYCVGRGYQCGLDAELRTDDLCPRGGVSLDKWFDGDRSDIALRESHGTYVAAGKRDRPIDPAAREVFLVAFRRHIGIAHPAFQHWWVMVVSLCLLGILVVMFATGRKAVRLLRLRRRYRDPALYTAGVRDEAGTITFGDGTRSLVAPGPPGPVVVRLAPAAEGGYRVAASASAVEIIEGNVDDLCSGLEGRAAAVLRTVGRWTVGAVFVPGVLAAALVLVGLFLR